MKEIGVVICNYNKKNFVLEGIQSVRESTIDNYDIYVVDNASTDGSVDAIRDQYGDQVNLLINKENLGGSDGFYRGLKEVLDRGYRYFFCLDDDALVDERALEILYSYMEENPNVGMAGCRVYHRQFPEYIQQSGLKIDFAKGTATTMGADMLEDGSLPEIVECDAVATCAVMVRAEICKEKNIGLIPSDNFIYWDDMEWGHRIARAGYSVVTLGSAKALHQMGANTKKPTTFLNYYMWRNRTRFFMKYTDEKEWDEMSASILSGVFDALYECMYRGEHNNMKSIAYAYQDALRGVRGKAGEDKILSNDANDDKLEQRLRQADSYCLIENGQEEDAVYLRNFIEKINPRCVETSEEEAKLVLELVPYIFRVKDFSLDKIYIDGSRNCLLDEEDVMAVANYEYSKMLYLYMNQPVFLEACRELHKGGTKNE